MKTTSQKFRRFFAIFRQYSVSSALLLAGLLGTANPAWAAGTGTVSPTSHDFGSVVVGQSSATQSFTVTRSTGNFTMGNPAAVLTGDTTQFDLDTSGCDGVNLKSPSPTSCSVTLTCVPLAEGSFSVDLDLVSADGTLTPDPVTSITCTGVADAPLAELDPDILDFNGVDVGDTSTLLLTLENNGSDTLTVTDIAISGADAAEFSFDPGSSGTPCSVTFPFTVNASESCTLDVTFAPLTPELDKTAQLTVTDDSGGVAGSTQSADLSGDGLAPDAALDPTSVNFGDQAVNVESAPETVTLENTGTDTLNITDISLTTGTVFDIDSTTCGATLAPGATCDINITFTPNATGPFNDTLTVTDDAFSGSTQTATLSGNGVPAGVPVIDLDPASHDFGIVVIPGPSAGQEFTITNNGVEVSPNDADLIVTDIATTGNFSVDVNAGTDPCGSTSFTLDPTESCTVVVTANPPSQGVFNGSLNVTSNTGGVAGTVTSAGLTVTGVVAGPDATLSVTAINFGDQVVGTTSSSQPVTVTNFGDANLVISSVSIAGSNASEFDQNDNCTGDTLLPGESCTIGVTFSPDSVGNKDAILNIQDNAPDSPQTVTLTGRGIPINPQQANLVLAMGVDPTSLICGQNATYTMTVTNNGTATADNVVLTNGIPNGLDFVSATPDDQCDLAPNGALVCDLGSIAAGDTEIVTLTVSTDASGTISNTASVTSPTVTSGPVQATVDLVVGGSCQPPNPGGGCGLTAGIPPASLGAFSGLFASLAAFAVLRRRRS